MASDSEDEFCNPLALSSDASLIGQYYSAGGLTQNGIQSKPGRSEPTFEIGSPPILNIRI